MDPARRWSRPSTYATPGAPADFELRNDIRRAFVALPPNLRVVATLALIEEVPHAEIADALGVPIGTVKSRLFRATRELRKELEPDMNDDRLKELLRATWPPSSDRGTLA